MENSRKILFQILENKKPRTNLAKLVHYCLIFLILLNVLGILFDTVESLDKDISYLLYYIEVASVSIFTIEYVFRLWCCIEKSGYKKNKPILSRLKYMISFFAIIDLMAILPFYIGGGQNLLILRIFRVLKILRYAKPLQLFARVFYKKREELLATFLIFLLFLIFISYIMYWAEKEAQPEQFSSIPAAMWWGIATLTTVGYGDMVPVTIFGKVISSIAAIVGIAMYALPSSIIVSGFIQEWNKEKERKEKKLADKNKPDSKKPG